MRRTLRLQPIRDPITISLSAALLLMSSLGAPARAAPAARLGGISILGPEPDQLSLALGAFNFNLRGPASNDFRAAESVAEYRLGAKWYGIGPMAGIMVNTRGGFMGYAGLYTDFRYRHLIVTPEAAIGGYRQGAGKYLGGIFQIREEISIAWQFSNGHRLGISYAHISNAGLHDRNPSEQELLLSYVLPVP